MTKNPVPEKSVSKMKNRLNICYILIGTICYVAKLSAAFKGIEGIYCGVESCYDVLSLKRDATKDDIQREYRKLAKVYHPDRFLKASEEEKSKAVLKFQQIATAYEVLKDEDSRRDYNDMLDDPEQYYRHYYRYYRRVYSAKVDSRLVVAGVVFMISVYQFLAMHSKYNEAINDFVSDHKFRFQALEEARQRGLVSRIQKKTGKTPIGRKNKLSKEDCRAQEEAAIRQVIEENLDLPKPTIYNTLLFQMFYCPIDIYNYVYWYVRWIYLFDIKKQEYGEQEKIYLISKYLGMSEERLHAQENVESLLKQQLWIKSEFDKWSKRKEQEMREKLAESSRYKRHRRYMKKGGPGQITFLDD